MKFLISFTLFTALILSSLITLVVTVDPYDKLGNNPFGFKTKAVAQSRENKFIMLENTKNKYQAFIIGSSAAHRFPTKTVKELTGLNTFNYSAQHTTPQDYLAIVRHIIDKQVAQKIFLQIGFIELSKNYKVDNRLYNSSLMKYLRGQKKPNTIFDNNYFTLDAIRDSFRVIFVNNFGDALHSNYLEHGNYKDEKIVKGHVKVGQASYKDWILDLEKVEILKEIKELCKKENIELIVFTAPLSFEHLKVAKAKKGYQDYLNTLKTVFGNFWNFHDDSLKAYNETKFFKNSTHPTREFSKILLKRMITKKPDSLGSFNSH